MPTYCTDTFEPLAASAPSPTMMSSMPRSKGMSPSGLSIFGRSSDNGGLRFRRYGRSAEWPPQPRTYLTRLSSLNIGRYMLMMITPTISPTPIIISGSMIEVSVWIDASTSSS